MPEPRLLAHPFLLTQTLRGGTTCAARLSHGRATAARHEGRWPCSNRGRCRHRPTNRSRCAPARRGGAKARDVSEGHHAPTKVAAPAAATWGDERPARAGLRLQGRYDGEVLVGAPPLAPARPRRFPGDDPAKPAGHTPPRARNERATAR